MRYAHLLDVIVGLSVALAACAPAAPEAMMESTLPADAMMSDHPASAETMDTHPADAGAEMMDSQPTAEAAQMPERPVAVSAAWMRTSLTDVVSGQQFTLADFHGKVVLIEPMAVWCTKCRALQQELSKVHQQLGDQAGDLVTISLDVDPNEEAAYLRSYVEQSGHQWSFVVAPAELARALESEYGGQFLNPPSTPLLLIDRSGNAQLMPFGYKTSTDVLAALQPLLAAGA